MKKKSVITILTTVLVYTTILPVPAYAALPANASTDVEAGNGFKDKAAFNYWADQYTEELKQIENPKDRYRRMVELLVTNWDGVKEMVGGQDATDAYLRGEIGADQAAYIVKRMCDNTGIECMIGNYLQDGYPNGTAYVRIDGAVYCYNRAALELWGMDDTYVFMDHDFSGMTIGNPFEPVKQEVAESKSTFEHISDMTASIYVLNTDDTFYTAALDSRMVGECLASGNKYFKCVDSKFVPITEEEAVALGYVEE